MIAFEDQDPVALRRGDTLSLEDLDRLLDIRIEDYDQVLPRLVREFWSKSISVDVPEGDGQPIVGLQGAKNSWVRLYAAQVQRLPKMDRADEFRFARRYEFMKARGRAALELIGHSPSQVGELLLGGGRDLPAMPGTTTQTLERVRAILRELEELRNRYVEGALYMVPAATYRYRNLGVDTADLIQEGNASLFQAIEGFDWRRDVRFKTYAQYWIHQAVLKVLYNSSRTVRVPIWVQKALSKIKRVRDQNRTGDGEPVSNKVVAEQLGFSEARVDELLRAVRRSVSIDAEIGGEDGSSLAHLLADENAPSVLEQIDDTDLGALLDEAMDVLSSREQLILERRFGLHGRSPETLGEIAADLDITAERVRQLQKAALTRLQQHGSSDRLRALAG